MRNLGITFLWLLLGAVTFFVALVHTGCASTTKPTTVKPEPKQTEALPMVCLQVERAEQAPVVICGSAQMCEHVHQRLAYFWEPLSVRYGATGLSECATVTAQFTER